MITKIYHAMMYSQISIQIFAYKIPSLQVYLISIYIICIVVVLTHKYSWKAIRLQTLGLQIDLFYLRTLKLQIKILFTNIVISLSLPE